MATIADYLKKILSAVYGKDVRQAIHDAIHQCYEDGKAARERIDNLAKLEEGSTTGDAELVDIRVGVDGTTYDSAGAAVRGQLGQISEEIVKISERTNILNIEDSIKGHAYRSAVGSEIVLIENTNYTACNQVFNVNQGEKYTHNWLYAACYIYDNEKKLVLYDYADTIPHTITIPANGQYMTVAGSTNQINDIMLVKDENIPEHYINYNTLKTRTEQGYENSDEIKKIKNQLNFVGIKWTSFGDSLTAKSTLANHPKGSKNYVDFVVEKLGLTVVNCGAGGTGYKKNDNNFVSRIDTIPDDTDILTVFGSFNDYEYIENSLGVFGDTTTDTLYGAMDTFFRTVLEEHPEMIVGTITPTKWGYLTIQYGDEDAQRRCDSYVKALTEVSEKYSIPVLDLYHDSNLRPWNENFRELYYKDDNGDGKPESVHLLQEAHRKFIAPKVENFIKSIYSVYN